MIDMEVENLILALCSIYKKGHQLYSRFLVNILIYQERNLSIIFGGDVYELRFSSFLIFLYGFHYVID